MLPTGNGQTLTVSFTPTDGTDFKTVTASVPINVLPQPAHRHADAMVIGEQPVFRRKLNKNGKPVGKAVLTGFTLDFNMPLERGGRVESRQITSSTPSRPRRSRRASIASCIRSRTSPSRTRPRAIR